MNEEDDGARHSAVGSQTALRAAGERDAATLQTAGTREAAALATAGQRRINLIWETTQATVAVIVAAGTMYVAGALVLRGDGTSATAFLLLSNAFFMIITAYFQRTNHTRVGGISAKDER